ncbi:DUF3048 domain-containing protein [Candidatus Daviesbacteria bacterium]|nr:DUF3048 domain-containing protein [Candidatus Levybacteria bacterium]MBI4039256.1 DUF3048 domain-containing protein [Candidatus Daviesbacteria bacterium]
MTKKIFFLGLVVYLVAAGGGYLGYGLLAKPATDLKSPLFEKPPVVNFSAVSAPTTTCPLNGVQTTKDQADLWYNRRPLAVMLENHVDARPQWGLSKADIIYEAVAEGGITRFLAIFFCQDAEDIAPIRSSRVYYLDWAQEYNPIYVHVGGANTAGPADALTQIITYGIKNLDEIVVGFPTFWRGPERPAPHNVHSTTKNLWEEGLRRGWSRTDQSDEAWDKSFRMWKFKEDAPQASRPVSSSVGISFWKAFADYNVTWTYDAKTNLYKRTSGLAKHVDALTQEQLTGKVILVQFTRERSADDSYPGNIHLLYGTVGDGRTLIFQDGKTIEGRWSKIDKKSKTIFIDKAGKEIEFNRGQIWIEVVPEAASITYN